MRGLERIDSDDPELAPVFQLFRGWDGNLSATGPQSAVYEVFMRQLIVLVTTPKLGELAPRYAGKGPTPVLAEGSMFGEHSREWLMLTLSNPQSPWWDAEDGRTRTDLICRAMRETVDILKKTCGLKMEDWNWGKIHSLTFGHPLGSVKPLDRIFNRGPYPIGGDGDTIWASGINRFDLGERDMVGPPFRFIADLSDWNNSLGMLVPGQSGHPASTHYDDNIAGWFKGEYHLMLFDRERVLANTTSALVLKP
jgi:penicillin amidase